MRRWSAPGQTAKTPFAKPRASRPVGGLRRYRSQSSSARKHKRKKQYWLRNSFPKNSLRLVARLAPLWALALALAFSEGQIGPCFLFAINALGSARALPLALKRQTVDLRYRIKAGRAQRSNATLHSTKSSNSGFWPNALVDISETSAKPKESSGRLADFILRLSLEIGRIMTFPKLLARITHGSVDHPPTLHGRTIKDFLRPGHNVLVLVNG